jgi:hypothetical protein
MIKYNGIKYNFTALSPLMIYFTMASYTILLNTISFIRNKAMQLLRDKAMHLLETRQCLVSTLFDEPQLHFNVHNIPLKNIG